MAKAIGVSASYVNMLENNQRSLSVQILMAIEEVYDVKWRNLVGSESAAMLAELRAIFQDPVLATKIPDIQELRALIDHAPLVAENLLQIYRNHRLTLDRLMRSEADQSTEDLLSLSPEAVIHDFFKSYKNYFPDLERAAERLRKDEPCEADEVLTVLKNRLGSKHGISVQIKSVDDMPRTLRAFDRETSQLSLSEALDHSNRTFQLAHMLCLLEFNDVLDGLTQDSGISSESALARCHVELANYFAAAFLMPYQDIFKEAERTKYDVDRLAASFGVSFEQVCHRLTTLQRKGSEGVPFFFLRVDKAGNVTKRFNATTFNLAEYGGSCPVWNIHTTFRVPGVILPQFVELPDGDRFFTISRTTDRPVFSYETQDRRLSIALGCSIDDAERVGYANQFNLTSERIFSPIGISCAPTISRQS